ncbi:Hypothetical predicted protein [Octopus vulgaris]|uniref:Uncharacterized protein n=1 Tax=Octopus vulgaris TaxID=6645 RepID=A0AA36ASC0_OCTVU|nr:Hypothetical predicted protein [Octopus vulgaris]
MTCSHTRVHDSFINFTVVQKSNIELIEEVVKKNITSGEGFGELLLKTPTGRMLIQTDTDMYLDLREKFPQDTGGFSVGIISDDCSIRAGGFVSIGRIIGVVGFVGGVISIYGIFSGFASVVSIVSVNFDGVVNVESFKFDSMPDDRVTQILGFSSNNLAWLENQQSI